MPGSGRTHRRRNREMGEKARHLIFKASMAIMLLRSMQVSKSNAESLSIEGLWAKDLASCPFNGPVKSGYMLISSDFLLTHVADCKVISNIIGPDSRNLSLKCRNHNTGNPWDQKFEIQKASPEGFSIRDTSG